ncbi:MAG TPA: methyltransferase [Devosia sp.]|nr:methyltransferase [Devosia sp.]
MTSLAYAEMALNVRALQMSQMLHVVAELGLADRIGDAPRAAVELASEGGADPQMLVRLLRALASFGIFAIDAAGMVSHTEKSRFLRSDAVPTLHYAARYWGMKSTWAAWGQFEHTVRTGKPGFEEAFGMPNFDYLHSHADAGAVFNDFMRHSPDDRHNAVARAYEFAGTVVDVGGGNGGLLQAVLANYPNAQGVLYDRPGVVAGAGEVLGPLSQRCRIVPGDFFESAPAGGDIYTLSQILHDWKDESCLTILGNCRKAMVPGARLLVIERVVEEVAMRTPAPILLGDLHMAVLFPGAKERSLSEFAALLAASGFDAPTLIPTDSAFSIVEARAR